jgi:hypothetical protein
MQITQLLDSNTLLNYSLITSPNPLQVSPQSGPPSQAQLTFVLSCPITFDQVTVTQITFNLPIGDPKAPDATDLTEVSTGISASVSSSGSDQWQIGPRAAAGSFVLTPKSGGTGVIGTQGLTVTLTGIQVSPIVGTAELDIAEMATATNMPAQARECTIALPKFPYGFYAGNFTASAPMVQDNATVVLSWVGSVQATYTLLWGTHSQVVSNVNQWTSPALTDTTTFILQVEAQEGGETVKLYFSITVIVANPNLVATTLQVLQTSALEGNVTVGSTAANANLNVNGTASATVVSTEILRVSGAASASSFMTSHLSASDATIHGLSTAGSWVSMIGGFQLITPGTQWHEPATYLPTTDGFAIGVISYPAYSSPGCMCYGYGQTSGVTVFATGGNVGFFGPRWGFYMSMNPNSFILPVQGGRNFYVAVHQNLNGQQIPAPYSFYWVPMGAGALELLAEPGSDFVAPVWVDSTGVPGEATGAPEFVAVLERVLGKPFDEITKQQMLESLRSL